MLSQALWEIVTSIVTSLMVGFAGVNKGEREK